MWTRGGFAMAVSFGQGQGARLARARQLLDSRRLDGSRPTRAPRRHGAGPTSETPGHCAACFSRQAAYWRSSRMAAAAARGATAAPGGRLRAVSGYDAEEGDEGEALTGWGYRRSPSRPRTFSSPD